MVRGAHLLAGFVCLVLFSGCAAGVGGEPTTPAVPQAGQTPTFSGPFAGDLQLAYQRAGSDLERQVLADGLISDAEVAEVLDRYKSCLENLGFTQVEPGADGSLSLLPPAGLSSPQAKVELCRADDGSGVLGLFREMRRNPQNQDENKIMAACLVKKGAVDPGYSAKDFAADSASGDESFMNSAAFLQCNADPLGLSQPNSG